MIKFPNSFLDEIKARILPSEIIRRKVLLKSHGRQHTGLCPFHKEKTPSFSVSDEKGFYHCFGCGAHGDIIKFIMETEGLTFLEAVKILAAQAGVQMPKLTEAQQAKEKIVTSLHEIMLLASNWFSERLYSEQGRETRDYLVKRGLNKKNAQIFALGYSPNNYHALKDFLKTKGITEQQMLDCGLLAKNDSGELYDKFRNRLMFPIRDIKGQVIAFGGRVLGEGQPKYLNSPETTLFKKGEILYNEDLARKTSFKTNRLIIAEGYMDVIAMYTNGITEVVAPLGTAITHEQILRAWRLSKEPIMCLDGDLAGQKAMGRVANLAISLLKPGYTIKFASLPNGMDPDDVIKADGPSKMLEILNKSTSLSDAIWQYEVAKSGIKTPEERALLESNLNQITANIKDRTVANHYKNFFRDKLFQIGKNSYRNKGVTTSGHRLTNISKISELDVRSRMGAESLLLLIILHNPNILEKEIVKDEFIDIDFSSIKLDKIRTSILETCFNQDAMGNKNNIIESLENLGFKHDIIYLNSLGIYQFQGDKRNYSEKTESYWEYALGLYNLAVMKEECNKLALEMDEISEKRVFEILKQIDQIEHKLSRVEEELVN